MHVATQYVCKWSIAQARNIPGWRLAWFPGLAAKQRSGAYFVSMKEGG